MHACMQCMSWVHVGKQQVRGWVCNVAKQQGLRGRCAYWQFFFLVSGLKMPGRSTRRHGAKRAQASTAELSDSRNSRERPREQGRQAGKGKDRVRG